ncbi:MAG: ATP-binding protein [Litorimonas sp.]
MATVNKLYDRKIDGKVAFAMLAQSPECVKLLDNTGKLRFMSDNGRTLMEIDDFSKVEGQSWWNLWPQDSRDMLRSAVAAANRGVGMSFEAACPTMGGAMKHWRVKVSPVKGGELDGMIVASSQDISDEVATKAAQQKLEVENLALRHFTRLAAHDLRGPIRHHKILAELISDTCDEGEGSDLRDYASEIEKSAAVLLDLLSDLEKYHTSADRNPDNIKPLAVKDMVARSITMAGPSRATINVHHANPDLHIRGDAGQILSAINNVLENAIKYGDPDAPCEISVETHATPDTVELTISDNGPGFPDAGIETVFQPLMRQANSLGKPGSGLGLSVVKQVIEGHGGHVKAANKATPDPRGAVITMTLPRLAPKCAPQKKAESA